MKVLTPLVISILLSSSCGGRKESSNYQLHPYTPGTFVDQCKPEEKTVRTCVDKKIFTIDPNINYSWVNTCNNLLITGCYHGVIQGANFGATFGEATAVVTRLSQQRLQLAIRAGSQLLLYTGMCSAVYDVGICSNLLSQVYLETCAKYETRTIQAKWYFDFNDTGKRNETKRSHFNDKESCERSNLTKFNQVFPGK